MNVRRLAPWAFALLLASFLSPARAGTCEGQGNASLTLNERPSIGGRLKLTVSGRRFARFSLLADTGAGPVTRPQIGTFCLDFGPDFTILVDGIRGGSPRIGSGGTYDVDLRIPNRAGLVGKTFHLQAIIVDSDAPNDYAITNSVSLAASNAIVEKFNDTAQRDTALTSAKWTGDGVARGVVSTVPRSISYEPIPSGGFFLPQPLIEANNPITNGCRFMMKWDPQLLGITRGESILAMSWGPQSNSVFGAAYLGLKMRLGHFSREPGASLSAFYEQNYTLQDPPVTVYEGNYSVPTTNGPWHPWPSFSAPFEYDSSRSLVFEVDMPVGGTTFQLFRNRSGAAFPINRLIGDGGANLAISNPEDTTYSMLFIVQQYRAYAQSVFIDTGLAAPDYHTPVLTPGEVPAGTSLDWFVEGATDPTDPSTYTGPVRSADAIDGMRYARFAIVLNGDTTNGFVATANSFVLPFD